MKRFHPEDDLSKVELHRKNVSARRRRRQRSRYLHVFFVHGGARVNVLQQLPPAGVVHAEIQPPFRLKSVLQTADEGVSVQLLHHAALGLCSADVVPEHCSNGRSRAAYET